MKIKSTTRNFALGLAAVSTLCLSASQAALYNVNIAGNSDTTAPFPSTIANVADGQVYKAPSEGLNQWNNVVATTINSGDINGAAPGSTGTLTDSNGLNPIALDISGRLNDLRADNFGLDPMMNGFLGSNGNTSTMTLTGLVNTQTYDIYVYFTWPFGPEDVANNYDITTGTGTVLGTTITQDRSTAADKADFVLGRNYAVLNNITPVNGVIAIQGTAGGDTGPWSGFQVSTSVPEPSSALLLGGVALLGLVRRRRI